MARTKTRSTSTNLHVAPTEKGDSEGFKGLSAYIIRAEVSASKFRHLKIRPFDLQRVALCGTRYFGQGPCKLAATGSRLVRRRWLIPVGLLVTGATMTFQDWRPKSTSMEQSSLWSLASTNLKHEPCPASAVIHPTKLYLLTYLWIMNVYTYIYIYMPASTILAVYPFISGYHYLYIGLYWVKKEHV